MANYYISTTDGNDTNDGLTTLTPWQTIEKLNEQTLSPMYFLNVAIHLDQKLQL